MAPKRKYSDWLTQGEPGDEISDLQVQNAAPTKPTPFLEEQKAPLDFTDSPAANDWFDFRKKKRK